MILNLDCIDGARCFPENSFDSIVTDPPYGLSDHNEQDVRRCMAAWLAGESFNPSKRGFMGHVWDAWVPGPEVWREAYRVLKPGGYLLCFASTRTDDLMSFAIRLAGFRKHAFIGWLNGSGFPKAASLSIAIDKQDGAESMRGRQLRFTEWMRGTGLRAPMIDMLTGSCMGGHYLTANSQPAVATRDHFEMLRPFVGVVPAWVETLVDWRTAESENFKRREVIGTKTARAGWDMEGGTQDVERAVTLAHTAAARQWEGWVYGLQSLKPAIEPCLMFQKPHIGRMAENVAAWGVGGVNVHGNRVPVTEADASQLRTMNAAQAPGGNGWGMGTTGARPDAVVLKAEGRWPANLVHDGSAAVLAGFPQSAGQQGHSSDAQRSAANVYGATSDAGKTYSPRGDTGSAARFFHACGYDQADQDVARFFYTGKASQADRNEGVDGRNSHPCIKPVALMRHLVRLVTPPGGVCADFFAGSGSTGKACAIEGFQHIGFEIDAEYAAIAQARIDHARSMMRGAA